MNRLAVLALAAFAALAVVQSDFADAARLGGGRSFGMQRSITPPAARTTPPALSGPAANPVMPAKPGVAAAAPAAGAAAAGAASRSSRWLGPIAGLAAGLGLAALMSHFGLSEGFGSLLLIGLLVVGAVMLFRAFAARRTPQMGAYAPGAGVMREPARFDARREPVIDAGWGSPTASAANDAPAAGRYPPGFDPAPFIDQAKQQFRRLQSAHDRGDRAFLGDMTTPAMHAEIARDIETRGPSQPTDVVALDADIVEVVQDGSQYVASVRFHGTLREDGADARAFEEVWNLVKPVDGSSGWLLAGIQQYA